MKYYRVELRASPDTPEEERRAQGRVLGPQTVIYKLCADSPEAATELAIANERRFLYRKIVYLFEPPTLIKDIDVNNWSWKEKIPSSKKQRAVASVEDISDWEGEGGYVPPEKPARFSPYDPATIMNRITVADERLLARTCKIPENKIVRVDQPWGYDLIWAKADRYIGKILHINAGQKLSRHFHLKKEETFLMQSGEMDLEIGKDNNIRITRMYAGDVYHCIPNTVHRMCAITDVDVVELSTPDDKDIIRLEYACLTYPLL